MIGRRLTPSKLAGGALRALACAPLQFRFPHTDTRNDPDSRTRTAAGANWMLEVGWNGDGLPHGS